ncbi:MAG: hypothetical protein ACRCSN_02665, partial [Dermatophilaceae bacterium]
IEETTNDTTKAAHLAGDLTGITDLTTGLRHGDLLRAATGAGAIIDLTHGAYARTTGATRGLTHTDDILTLNHTPTTVDNALRTVTDDELDLVVGGSADAERALRDRQVTSVTPIEARLRGNHLSYVVRFEDGGQAIYKPITGEDPGFRPGRGAVLANREVATYKLDSALGFELVPTTVMWDRASPRAGAGSLQQWAPDGSLDAAAARDYPTADQDRMAVLDYVSGNTDRNLDNYLTDPDGRPVAIDNGGTFPTSERYRLRSGFIAARIGEPLDTEVLEQVRAVDTEDLGRQLRAAGLGDAEVDAALARLEEVRRHGAIRGEAWGGEMVDANNVSRIARPGDQGSPPSQRPWWRPW